MFIKSTLTLSPVFGGNFNLRSFKDLKAACGIFVLRWDSGPFSNRLHRPDADGKAKALAWVRNLKTRIQTTKI
jgi:hypothetical protein